MINEGPRMILRLPKIRQALIAHPEPFRWYSKRKIELELLMLMQLNIIPFCRDETGVFNMSDEVKDELPRRINMIVGEVCQRMIMEGNRVNNLKDVHDGMLM